MLDCIDTWSLPSFLLLVPHNSQPYNKIDLMFFVKQFDIAMGIFKGPYFT